MQMSLELRALLEQARRAADKGDSDKVSELLENVLAKSFTFAVKVEGTLQAANREEAERLLLRAHGHDLQLLYLQEVLP